MKSNALLLSALMMSPLAAQTQDAPSIFAALPTPAREMQTAPAQEIYSTRAQIPAGDYELIADVRELPALAKLIAAPSGAIPLESATLVSTKGNLSELKEYLPMIALIQLLEQTKEKVQSDERNYKALVNILKQNPPADQGESDDLSTAEVKRRTKLLEHSKAAILKQQRVEAQLVAEIAEQSKKLPTFSVKPAYLSLQFTQPQIVQTIMAGVASAPHPAMKPLRVGEAIGYELDLTALPEPYKTLFQQKLQATPTLLFFPVDAHKLVVMLGTGTEALDKLKSGGTRMTAPSITVPREVKAHLWVDAQVTQPLSAPCYQNLKKALMCSFTEDDRVMKLVMGRVIDSLHTLTPQFSEGIGMQIWTQDGDVQGRLSTAMHNYQLQTAAPLGALLTTQPEIEFYGEVSPLPESETRALADLLLHSGTAMLWGMYEVAHRFGTAESEAIDPSELEPKFLENYKNIMSAGLKLLPSLEGNIGMATRVGAPYNEENPEFKRTHRVLFSGIKDKAKLASDFREALETISQIAISDEAERKDFVENVLQTASNAKENDFCFRAGSKLFALGNDVKAVEALVAREDAPAPAAVSGARLLWRGEILEQELSPPLREKVEGFYLRLDSAGEKKDVYFKLDMK